jgi:Protein of unknown function (DUF4232)
VNLRMLTGGRVPAGRRILAAGAVTCAAVLVPANALASAGPPAPVARTVAPPCASSGVDVWLDTQGNGAAGRIYYHLEFTNLSGSTCALFGFPGVSGISLNGAQLGSAAAWDQGRTPRVVTLASGATARARLAIVDVGVFSPSQCQQVTAAGLRVFLPGQGRSRVVPFPFAACSKSGPNYLVVRAVRK